MFLPPGRSDLETDDRRSDSLTERQQIPETKHRQTILSGPCVSVDGRDPSLTSGRTREGVETLKTEETREGWVEEVGGDGDGGGP